MGRRRAGQAASVGAALSGALVLAGACGSGGTGAGAVDGGLSGPAAGSAGPAANANACERPEGLHDARFTRVSGNCGSLDEVSSVDLSGGSGGVSNQIQTGASARITTELVYKGCSLGLTVTTEDTGDMGRSVLEGQELVIGADGRVTGAVSFARYDASGAETCSGSYDLILERPAGVGAAAGGSTIVDGGTGSLDPILLAEVEDDCAQTVMCRAQMAEVLDPDPVAGCVDATARLLVGDEARQTSFLATRERCRNLVVCEYYNCALAR